jgi:hypothetical protein
MKNQVYIIGGGISLKDFNFSKLKNKDTIVVNKSLLHVPNPNYFITMDFTAIRKIKNQNINLSNSTKIFIANFSKRYMVEINGQIVDTRFNLIYNLKDFDMIIKSYKANGIGLVFNDFRNGDNSGYCAFQLAILLGYKKIYLLGMDLNITQETHFHGGYGESKQSFKSKLDIYYQFFEEGLKELNEKAKNIQVYNCSKISKLKKILPYKEL